MVERRKELDARYARKRKMKKLKAKLVAPGSDREKLLAKIHKISPWWTEASLEQAKGNQPVAAAPAAEEPKKKAAPKPKPKA